MKDVEFLGTHRSEALLDEGAAQDKVVNFISPSAQIGAGTQIWHFAVVQAEVEIGMNCSVGSCAEISRGAVIGNNVRIGHGTILAPTMRVGNNVFIGPGVQFLDDRDPVAGNTNYQPRPPRVCDGASIGAGAIILPGIIIGENSLVGAGAVVARDVPAGMVIRGERASILRARCFQ